LTTLQFIAAIVSALAWPASVCIIAVKFGDPLTRLLGRVKSLEGPGFKVDTVGAEIREIEAKVETAEQLKVLKRGPTEDHSLPLLLDYRSRIREIAQVSPNAAVVFAWMEVERELRAFLARSHQGDLALTQGRVTVLLNTMHERGILDPFTFGILTQMRAVRNKCAHPQELNEELSSQDAEAYADLAAQMVALLRSLDGRIAPNSNTTSIRN
jgi:hypothetical protein